MTAGHFRSRPARGSTRALAFLAVIVSLFLMLKESEWDVARTPGRSYRNR